MGPARQSVLALLALFAMAAAVAGCGARSAKPAHTTASATKVATAVGPTAKHPPASTAAKPRPPRHHARATARSAAPAVAPKSQNAVKAEARGIAEATCMSTRNGLEKVVGGHISPGDSSAAPALVARLEGLQHHAPGGPLDPQARSLSAALARATTLAREWGAVLVIGPGDQQKAEELGKQVFSAVGAVNTAAKAAGLGACAIPLG
jgi:hypothetical protein